MGSPQKNNRENVKFGLKFSVYTSISSELMGTSSQSFIQTTCREPGVITWVQFLEGLPPKIWEGKKPSKIFRNFWQLSTLIVNISGADPQIENRKSSWSTATPPTSGYEKFLNFGPQTKKLSTWVLTHRSAHFSGDCIKGGCALKFLHALEIDQGYLAHTPIGTGSPPPKKKLIVKI